MIFTYMVIKTILYMYDNNIRTRIINISALETVLKTIDIILC